MPEAISDFLQKRGALALLTVLAAADGFRFTDLEAELTISSSTLSQRLAEARSHGLVTPGMNPSETSVRNEYRITTRGERVVRRMERQGITHACQTILDYTHRIEEEMDGLLEWVTTHQAELARLDDQPAYVDAFGESVTNPVDEEVEYDEEYMGQSGGGPGDDDGSV